MTYDEIKTRLQKLLAEGKITGRPTDEQRIDWAYGNTVMENPKITRELVRQVFYEKKGGERDDSEEE